MLLAYPVNITQDENSIIAEFPDVPEAITLGSDIENALTWAQDALIVALCAYVDERRDIPKPSKTKRGQMLVGLPSLVAAKIAIYLTMREQKITQEELAKRLQCDARQVRRLLDLDHHSRFDLIDKALHALGKQLYIEIKDAA